MEAGPRDDDEIWTRLTDRTPEDTGDLAALDGVDADGDTSLAFDGETPPAQAPEEPHELRPVPRLRAWQLAPIVLLGALGSLMFAFPLAFEPGGRTGAVVATLGLLICGCAAGWGVTAAHRAGHVWPGLPTPDSGERPDWRVVALYALVVGTLLVLAVWRVARLR